MQRLSATTLLLVDGSGEWSVVWDFEEGTVLKSGDTDVVHEWLIRNLGVETDYDFIDNDWVPNDHDVLDLDAAQKRRAMRYARNDAATKLYEQIEKLTTQAKVLERPLPYVSDEGKQEGTR